MTTLKTFLDSKSITAEHLFLTSRRIETLDLEGRGLLLKRAQKRGNKDLATKKYAELELAKPKMAGRGLTKAAIGIAIAGKPQSRKLRSKVLHAVNAVLATKKQPAVDMKALFEGVEMRKGKAPVKKDAKK